MKLLPIGMTFDSPDGAIIIVSEEEGLKYYNYFGGNSSNVPNWVKNTNWVKYTDGEYKDRIYQTLSTEKFTPNTPAGKVLYGKV